MDCNESLFLLTILFVPFISDFCSGKAAGYHADHSDCNYYFWCGAGGVLHARMLCAQGTVAQDGAPCVWPHESTCGETILTTATPSTTTTQLTTSLVTTETTPTTSLVTTETLPTTSLVTTETLPTTSLRTTETPPTTSLHTTETPPTTSIVTTKTPPTTSLVTTETPPTTSLGTTKTQPTSSLGTTKTQPTSSLPTTSTQPTVVTEESMSMPLVIITTNGVSTDIPTESHTTATYTPFSSAEQTEGKSTCSIFPLKHAGDLLWPSSYDVWLPSVRLQVQVTAGTPSRLAWSLYKSAALWRVVYGPSATDFFAVPGFYLVAV